MSEPLVQVSQLRVAFGPTERAVALDDVSFAVRTGELVTVVGPSGSGKTTLLRCLAGLIQPTSGEIRVDGRAVRDVPAELAIVFQDYGRSLFPWMNVHDNVGMPLRRLDLSRAERQERIALAVDEVGLAGSLSRYPWELSGGMQQRVAIARAIAYQPRILLMDEPFASVDAQTRADLQDTTLEVWRRHASTIVFVTHDIDEAVFLGDRVLVLTAGPGRVQAEITLDLPRPRDQIETRASPQFVELRSELARLIHRQQ